VYISGATDPVNPTVLHSRNTVMVRPSARPIHSFKFLVTFKSQTGVVR
jgi:hypothetical protein